MSKSDYAGFLPRLGAVGIDFFFFLALLLALTFVLIFPALLFGFLSVFTSATFTAFALVFWIGGSSAFMALHWLYYAGFEASSLQATPGKLAMKLRVCTLDRQRITLKQSTLRYGARYLSTFLLCFGYLISFFTDRRQTLHDLISETLVIRMETLPQQPGIGVSVAETAPSISPSI